MDNLKALRESKKITQTQLGEHIGAKKNAISLWESGKRQPDQETLVRLANFFGVTVDYLLGRNDPHPPAQEKAPAERRTEAKRILEQLTDEQYEAALAMLKLLPVDNKGETQ